MASEDDSWWCHGVEPGGLTANGEGPVVAFQRFCLALREMLNDLAEECVSFERFQREAESFFKTDRTEEGRWNDAVESVRAKIRDDVLEEPFRDMKRLQPRGSRLLIRLLVDYATSSMTEVLNDPAVALSVDKLDKAA
jgi:hypothetical protein